MVYTIDLSTTLTPRPNQHKPLTIALTHPAANSNGVVHNARAQNTPALASSKVILIDYSYVVHSQPTPPTPHLYIPPDTHKKGVGALIGWYVILRLSQLSSVVLLNLLDVIRVFDTTDLTLYPFIVLKYLSLKGCTGFLLAFHELDALTSGTFIWGFPRKTLWLRRMSSAS